MAIDMYLQLNGITGESTTTVTFGGTSASGLIQIEQFSFEVDDTVTLGATGGSGAGRPTFKPLSFSKGIDSTTPALFGVLVTGRQIATGGLYLVKPGGSGGPSGTPAYFAYHFKQIYLSQDTVSSDASGSPVEAVQMEFAAVQVAYSAQRPDGTYGPPTVAQWNQVRSTNSF